jgi:hypothetical protein
MFKTLQFFINQKPIKLETKDSREIKRERFTRIKQKVTK